MKKHSLIVIVILSIVIVGLCAFIAYDKNLFGIKGENKKESDNVQQEQKVEEVKEEALDVNSEQVTTLINKITNVTNNIYISGRYLGYYFQKDELKSEDIDDSLILYTALRKFLGDKNISSYEESVSVSKNDIIPIIKEIFGNVEYENKTIKITPCELGSFIYDDNTGTYTAGSSGCGGTGTSITNHKIIDAVKKNNTIEITLAIVYATCGYEQQSADIPGQDYCTFGNSIDENQKLRDDDIILKVNAVNSDYDELFDFNTYIDKLNKYKFTFTKDNNNNNNYVFTKVEKV